MKKILYLFSLILFISLSSCQSDNVYVCVSEDAPAYHFDKDCFGLANCTYEIRTVSKYEAINNYNRRLCGYED